LKVEFNDGIRRGLNINFIGQVMALYYSI